MLKPKSSITPRIISLRHPKILKFIWKTFKITEKDRLYECKLGEGINSRYCTINYISQSLHPQTTPLSSYLSTPGISKLEKPFLKECTRRNSSQWGNKIKNKWKSIIESAIEVESWKDSESFCSKSQGYSMVRDLFKSESWDSFRESYNQKRFKAVSRHLLSLQNLHGEEIKKIERNQLFHSTKKNFIEKVSYYEKLLNSIKTSPLLKNNHERVDIKEQNSCK